MEKYVKNIKDLVIQTLTNGSEIRSNADNGDPVSCFQMGLIYLLGINTPIDFKMSSKYFANNSLSNDGDANRLLGFIAECEGNYSLAFKHYANAVGNTGANAKNPYVNKVSIERNNLQNVFKKYGLPNILLNKEITAVLNDYIKGGNGLIETKLKLAYICEDESSCLEAAQILFESGDFYSAKGWLQKGKVDRSNSLFVSIEDKIIKSKKIANLPKDFEVIDIDGASFLDNCEAAPLYAGIKQICDEGANTCKHEWQEKIGQIIKEINASIEKEEYARLQKIKAEEEARLRKQKEEEEARLRKQKEEEQRALMLKMAEEEKERNKKRKQRIIDIILLVIFGFFEFIIFAVMISEWAKASVLINLIAFFFMSAIFVVLPFMALRWLLRIILKVNK